MNHRSRRGLRLATVCTATGGALAIAGFTGTPASAAPAHDPFTISGAPNAVLYPGGVAGTIDLTLTNPNRRPLRLLTLAVDLTAVTPATCALSNFAIDQIELPAGRFIIPARGDVALSELGLTVAQLPAVRMLETGVAQDECQGASVALTYSGRAIGPDREVPGGGGWDGDDDWDDDDHDHDHDGHDHDHDRDHDHDDDDPEVSGGHSGLPGTGASGLQGSMTVTGLGLLAAGIAGIGVARRRRGAEQ